MHYAIEPYTAALRDQILKLQTHLWSPDESLNSKYFQWKYERNPYRDFPCIDVAHMDQEVVGMRGHYGARWQANEPAMEFDMLCAGDSVIVPEHRNAGLLSALINAGMAHLNDACCPSICSFSTGYLTFLNSLALGWRSAGFIETMYRGSSIPQFPVFPERRFFISSEDKDHPFYDFDRSASPSRLRISQAAESQAMAELVKLCRNDGRITHVRDEQYFRWRFQNPLCDYRFLYQGSRSIEGYLVLQSSIYSDRKTVSIVDWESTDVRISKDLLQAAIELGNFDNLMIWSSSLTASLKTLLQESGFQYLANTGKLRTSRHTLLIRTMVDQSPKGDFLPSHRLLALSEWNLRMIYSDGF